MMIKVINLDMDGTIADLYSVENWLPKLRAYDASPYKEAAPLVRLSTLAYYLNKARQNGWQINIVSWLSKDSTPTYGEAVATAKIDWLRTHLPSVHFDAIVIVPYGTPKHELAQGILFDDEKPNRDKWNAANRSNKAYDVDNIFGVLKEILN